MEQFLQPPYLIFSLVGGFVLALAALEIMLFFFGASLSKLFHHDIDVDHVHDVAFNADPDLHLDIDHNVNLLNFGEVPLVVILLSFCMFFTLSGFSIHHFTEDYFKLSNLVSVPVSLFSSSLLTYATTSFWKKIFPNTESYSINIDELLGQTGVVVLGKGSFTEKVQISVVDKFGATHYIMARSSLEGQSFKQGEHVTLIQKFKDGSFGAIPQIAQHTFDTMEKELRA